MKKATKLTMCEKERLKCFRMADRERGGDHRVSTGVHKAEHVHAHAGALLRQPNANGGGVRG